VHIVTGNIVSAATASGAKTALSTATCATGFLLGGGATTTGTDSAIGVSRPAGGTSTTAWEAAAENTGSSNNTIGVTAYAICSGP
jgi:hypothetical protein